MSVFAAVMTGKGTGAISTIEVFGDTAEAVTKKIFNPAGGGKRFSSPAKSCLAKSLMQAKLSTRSQLAAKGETISL
jgi:hypothetical protein